MTIDQAGVEVAADLEMLVALTNAPDSLFTSVGLDPVVDRAADIASVKEQLEKDRAALVASIEAYRNRY